MLKKPLIETNPYLKDAARYRRDLVTTVSSSTAIETGARPGTIAKSLPAAPAALERDKAWDDLAAKRDAEIERGESTPVSGPEAVARLRLELA